MPYMEFKANTETGKADPIYVGILPLQHEEGTVLMEMSDAEIYEMLEAKGIIKPAHPRIPLDRLNRILQDKRAGGNIGHD